MKSKDLSFWEKLQDAESADWTLEEVKAAIHWFRQLVSFVCGLLWGIIPFTGFYSFATEVALNTMSTVVFYTTVMKVDPEEFGGHGALAQEAMAPSISMFLLSWTIAYSLVQF